jgi:tetratricopeptide (TPR) repeat protein
MQYGSASLLAATLAMLVVCTAPSSADEYSQGASKYTAGDYAGAKSHLIKASLAKPRSWQAHYQLANTYVQLKDSANAKKSYLKCIACHPPADIKTNCTTALTYITSNPRLTAPVASAPAASRPVQMIMPKQATATPSTSISTSTSTSTSTPAVSADLTARRARIIQDGEEEVTKMKAQEKERQQEMENNSNQRYVLPDGSVRPQLSQDEQVQLQRDVEQKSAAIRDRAKRRAADLK